MASPSVSGQLPADLLLIHRPCIGPGDPSAILNDEVPVAVGVRVRACVNDLLHSRLIDLIPFSIHILCHFPPVHATSRSLRNITFGTSGRPTRYKYIMKMLQCIQALLEKFVPNLDVVQRYRAWVS